MEKILAQVVTLPNDTVTNGGTWTLTGPVEWAGTIGSIVTRAIPFIFMFAGFGLLLMLIAGGFGLMTSAGDAKKLQAGQQRITYAILGFVVIFLAYWVVQIVGKIFGLSDITNNFL